MHHRHIRHLYSPLPNMSILASTTECRSVWLLACPLSRATFRPFSSCSNGKYPFCHWGVLTTNASWAKITACLKMKQSSIDVELGTLYQLLRNGDGYPNTVRVSHPFTLSELHSEWRQVFGDYINTTSMSHKDIETTGSPLISFLIADIAAHCITEKRPGYQFITNNCQNFARWLMEAITPGTIVLPQTIEMFLNKFILPRSQSRSSSPSYVSFEYTRATSLSSTTTFEHPLENLALPGERDIQWTTLKASLDPGIKSDIQQWGDPILYDSFSVEIRPVGSAGLKGSLGTYYCALFHRKLLFLDPHLFRHPTDCSVYRLVGAVNVQQDLNDVHLLADPAVKPVASRKGSPPVTTLEFCMFLDPSRYEHRVHLKCGQGMFAGEDRLRKWAEMLGVVKRFSISTRDPVPRHSFIFSPVTLLACVS
jgi:hypothetical protein